MSYFAEANYIEYEESFNAHIAQIDLIGYSNESEFANYDNAKFYQPSARNININSSKIYNK